MSKKKSRIAPTVKAVDDSIFICPDCGVDAWDFAERDVFVHEDFYVQDDLWEKACANVADKVICIGCFERRLGRELSQGDFKCPPRDLFGTPPSRRFQERYGVSELTARSAA